MAKNQTNNNNQVYSYGIITPSTLLMLEWEYPKADQYAEVKHKYDMTGGEACNSAIVLGNLDVNVALDGLWLGDNQKALLTKQLISTYNVDTSLITIKPDFDNVEEVVVADKETRTIFASYGKLFKGKRMWNAPNEDYIKNSTIVCLDPFLEQDSIKVAELCVKNNIPYVTVDCHYDTFIANNATVNIISGEFRSGNFKDIDKVELLQEYMSKGDGVTILTSANNDIIYSYNNEIHYFTPYQVEAIDTAGAGDSFRSGIIYGLLHGYSIDKTIAFASLLASYVCQSFPGVINSPSYDELMEFSNKQNYDFNKL